MRSISSFDEATLQSILKAKDNMGTVLINYRQSARSLLFHIVYLRYEMQNQIVVLRAGIVEEIGNHDELMQNQGLYRELVEEQNILEVQA